ncbi:MAG: hypothetical protein ACKPKO_18220, partial [Candidatus Fonsibacter sp.]
ANVTAWSSASALLAGFDADALLIQDHHVVGRPARDRIEAAQCSNRWPMSFQFAEATRAGGTSAGVGVAVVRRTGLALSPGLEPEEEYASRVSVRHWGAVCPGGVHLLTVYLHNGEGLPRRNLDILHAVEFLIGRLRGAWICG